MDTFLCLVHKKQNFWRVVAYSINCSVWQQVYERPSKFLQSFIYLEDIARKIPLNLKFNG